MEKQTATQPETNTKEWIYLINLDKPFCGSIVWAGIKNETKPEELQDILNRYNLKNWHLMDFDTFYNLYQIPFNNQLTNPKNFKEISEEKYWDLFECLPPLRYSRARQGAVKIEFFYVMEAYHNCIHTLCYQITINEVSKFYEVLASRYEPTEKLIKQIIEHNTFNQ